MKTTALLSEPFSLSKKPAERLVLFSVFYTSFSQSDEAYEILDIINVRVCPYCNRQYTFTARKNGEKTRPQFDHYFPKSLYPYLAISIYNLVPSCALCNNGKSTGTPENILYPYEESFEDRKIRFVVDNIIPYLLGTQKNIVISLDSYDPEDISAQKIINEYYKSFKIKIPYELHSDRIEALITEKAIFNNEALENIYSSYSDILGDPQHLEELIFEKYDNDSFINHPLSKLTSDIWDQL
ncbi:MAG: HNH endonuclease [Huintestinicola sp.]